ncbi:hypothetical protein GCM10027589_03140 [Actinocorallia lasiicapitis]
MASNPRPTVVPPPSPRQPRRSRAGRDYEQLAWWTLFAVLAAAAVWTLSWRLLLLTVLLWSFYEVCLVRARCRVKTREGFECKEFVRGRVFAHDKKHQEVKNDGLWLMVGRPNPYYDENKQKGPRDTGVVLVAPRIRGRLARQDRVLIYLAFAGLVASLTGMFWGLFS